MCFYYCQTLLQSLFWPILYNPPFFNVKGSTFLTNFYFCCTDNVPQIWSYQYQCFNILLFNQFPSLLTFLCLRKCFCLSSQFNDRCHNSNKVFDKAYVKLCRPIEYLNLLMIIRWWHVYYCLYFLWI
jgi:hypothetical protein